MAEKSSSEMQEQELDYCTSSSDDSDITMMIDALDLCEEVLEEGVAELILVSRKVRVSWIYPIEPLFILEDSHIGYNPPANRRSFRRARICRIF